MNYRALITDIDGTLVWQQRQRISDGMTAAMRALQARGIPVIYATGRGPYACLESIFGGLEAPDYRVCCNGAFIVDKRGNILHEQHLTLAEVEALTALAQREGYHLNFTFEDAYYVYVHFEEFAENYMKRVGHVPYLRDGSDRTRHRESLPFCGFITMPSQGAALIQAEIPGIRAMSSVVGSYDLAVSSVDKRIGVGILLEQLGIPWSDVVAIGDNENDIGMVGSAGMGVAMGNACDALKAIAKDITAPVSEDGALLAIQKYFGQIVTGF